MKILLRDRASSYICTASQVTMATKMEPELFKQCRVCFSLSLQVMPQLLNSLSVDSTGASIDWGTLAVYTCSASCSDNDKQYCPEFVWKQDFSSDQPSNSQRQHKKQ